jgi:hypothetical protein
MPAQFDIAPGLDPSALSSITQAQLLQMVAQLAPLSNIGGVIFGTSAGVDVANNQRFKRYILLDTTGGTTLTPRYYDQSEPSGPNAAGNWTAVSVTAGSIVNASVAAAAAIAITKLAIGTARYILRTNSGGTANEFISPASIFAANELPVNSLVAGGGAGYLKTSGGVVQWIGDATERAAIISAITGLAPSQIQPGAINTVLGTNSAGSVVMASINTILANGAISLLKLDGSSASATNVMAWDGSTWLPTALALKITSGSPVSTIGILSGNNFATAVHTIAHGLTVIPKMVRVVGKMTNAVADLGWNQNDEVDIYSFRRTTGNFVLVNVGVDATNVTIALCETSSELGNKATGVYAGIDETKWFPKVYAWA